MSGLYGVVRGYHLADIGDARAALQPLMLRYGFDAVEREGTLTFMMRDGRKAIALDPDALVDHSEIEGRLELVRGSDVDLAGRVRASFVEADADFDVVVEETVLPDEASHAVSATDMPLVMTRTEARQTLERWLSEARVSREALRFALPPSRLDVRAGDVVQLPGGQGDTQFRVDRIEHGTSQIVEAVRIEPNVYEPAPLGDAPVSMRPFQPAVPVLPYFLDLPLMTGNEDAIAPHIAVTAEPWPGSVAVYDAPIDADYGLNTYAAGRSTVGVTETPLFAASSALLDRGAPLRVRLANGAFESIARETLLAGGNLLAIGDGSSSNWELLQFQSAELVAPDTYEISLRLRGLYGTDAAMPDAWPIGSVIVAMNGVPNQIGMPAGQLGAERHYRIGPAARAYDDPSYEVRVERFNGAGLRPYAPVHLNAERKGGDLEITWIRRTRVGGDEWSYGEPPLMEDTQSYEVSIVVGGVRQRVETVEFPFWIYTAAEQAADGVTGVFEVRVAQISARYGPGPTVRKLVTP